MHVGGRKQGDRADRFRWKFVSDRPGLIESRGGLIIRAEPVVFDDYLGDFLVIVGGDQVNHKAWSQRVRAMQQRKNPVVLLSDAATAYIKAARYSEQKVTTHWQDVRVLEESGCYPHLTGRYAENSEGIITSAGVNYTTELTIGLISDFLSPKGFGRTGQSAYGADHPRWRGAATEGAKLSYKCLWCRRMAQALRTMEENTAEPLPTSAIAMRIGLSQRQLERQFNATFNTTPARYYKTVRLEKARDLVTETDMKLIDIAIATGFSSVSSLSVAFRDEFGQSPTTLRRDIAFSHSIN